MSNSKPLWAHQIKNINRAFTPDTSELFIADDMGTGKTRSIIEILRRLFANQGRIMNTLIVCPLAVKRQWKAAILEYSKLRPIDIVVLDNSQKRRCKEFYDAVQVDGVLMRNKIVIVNPATFEMKDLLGLLKTWEVEVLVIDEAHEFKAHNGTRARAVLPIADRAKYRILSTGSPIANTESDIWMQYRILDGGKTFGTNFHIFKKKYYVDENASWAHKQNHFPKYVCSEEGKEEIRALMYKKAVRTRKDECLDLPPLVRQELEVFMSPEQTKAYNEMKEDFLTWMKDKHEQPRAIVANLAITKAMKMQQIISGFAFDEKGEPVRFKNVPRLATLKEQLEQLIAAKKKVIVWAAFIENYRMIADIFDELGVKYGRIVGGMSGAEKHENVRLFNEDPEMLGMIANQGAGGTGIDGLTLAGYSIYYSKDASLLKDSQSEARNYRKGSEQHECVTRIDLVCYGTLDESVNDALANKKSLAQYILDEEVL